jgi:methionine biosynthesis protein MetW
MNSSDTSGVAAYYDTFWSGDQERIYRPEPALLSLIDDAVTAGSDCLDVGCGSGNSYARLVARRAGSYVGVDVSANAVKAARESGLDARVIEDAAELPFDDGTFNVALCIEVLEHLFAPHQAAAEIHRVLRPGGQLIASVPNLGYWRMRANAVLGRWNPLGDELAMEQPWRDPHIRFFTPEIMRRMLGMAGFSRVEVGAHGGRFLDHVTSRPTDFGTSRLYQLAEGRVPSLLGLTIHVAATK